MKSLSMFVIFIIAAVCYMTLIESAAVRSDEIGELLERMALTGEPGHVITQRDTGGKPQGRRPCHNGPCGWSVYRPFSRLFNYYIENVCDCPNETYRCVRTDDDLSANAWVHRCRQNTTEYDIGPPEYDEIK